MLKLFSPAALLLYTFAPHTHVAAINVSQTQDIYPEVVSDPGLSGLALLSITSAALYQSKSPNLHCIHQKKRVYKETVTWQYSTQTLRALHQLLRQ